MAVWRRHEKTCYGNCSCITRTTAMDPPPDEPMLMGRHGIECNQPRWPTSSLLCGTKVGQRATLVATRALNAHCGWGSAAGFEDEEEEAPASQGGQ